MSSGNADTPPPSTPATPLSVTTMKRSRTPLQRADTRGEFGAGTDDQVGGDERDRQLAGEGGEIKDRQRRRQRVSGPRDDKEPTPAEAEDLEQPPVAAYVGASVVQQVTGGLSVFAFTSLGGLAAIGLLAILSGVAILASVWRMLVLTAVASAVGGLAMYGAGTPGRLEEDWPAERFSPPSADTSEYVLASGPRRRLRRCCGRSHSSGARCRGRPRRRRSGAGLRRRSGFDRDILPDVLLVRSGDPRRQDLAVSGLRPANLSKR